MTTIVWGHGTRSRGDETTFVPDGTTVKWYSNVDENLLTTNGFLAIQSGDFGNPIDEQGPGEGTRVEIFNYVLSNDLVKQDWVSLLHRGSERLEFVGDGVTEGPLCTSPPACRTAGRHQCAGLFNQVNDTEIVILVCRGLPGGTTATAAFDTGGVLEDLKSDMGRWVGDFRQRVLADPDAAMQEFSELSDPLKITLTQYFAISGIQAVHWGAWYAASGDVASAFGQLTGAASNASAAELVDQVAVYRERFAQGALADPARFMAAMDQLAEGPLRAALLRIDVVAGVVRQGQATEQWEQGGPAVWVPSEGDLASVAELNRAVAKDAGDGDSIDYVVAGLVLLLGGAFPQDWYDWADTQPDVARGTMVVAKGSLFGGAGSFTVSGCPPAKQGVVEAAIGSFSDKTVTFA